MDTLGLTKTNLLYSIAKITNLMSDCPFGGALTIVCPETIGSVKIEIKSSKPFCQI